MVKTSGIFAVCILCYTLTFGQGVSNENPIEEYQHNPEDLITELYKTVSVVGHNNANWDKVKSMFVDEAVVILRSSPTGTKQLTLEGYIKDFQDFYNYPAVKAKGFEEKILKMKTMVFKDMAFITTVYTAHIPGSPNKPQQGIDFWLLRKKENLWKIVAITNEIIPPGTSLPDGPEWTFR